jgi:ClpP class serine protease
MLACACDKIVSSQYAKIGSVGVIASVTNYNELTKKVGVTQKTFKTGKYKEVFPSSDPFDETHIDTMNELMDDAFNIFKGIVMSARHLSESQMEVVFSAKVMHGTVAMQCGLIDEIKNLGDFLNDLSKEHELYMVSMYGEKKSKLDGLLSMNFIPEILGRITRKHFSGVNSVVNLESVKYE